MTVEDFDKAIDRHVAFKEYDQAFLLCVENLSNDELRKKALEKGRKLLSDFNYKVLGREGRKRRKRILTVLIKLSLDMIADKAVTLKYEELKHSVISMGLFSPSIPCVAIGSLLSKQKFGIRINRNKDRTIDSYSLIYTVGPFAKDFRLLTGLVNDIIDLLYNSKQ